MTPEQQNLARRLVACRRWRWLPGMVYEDRGRRYRVDESFLASARENWHHGCTLVVDDPATMGCLLALVRETWGDPEAHLALGAVGWVLMSGESRVADVVYPSPAGKTEAEALVAALRAAPQRRQG